MNDKQKEVLTSAYNSFDIQLGYMDYEFIGRIIVLRRILAELLGLDLSTHIMPGEYIDEDEKNQEYIYIDEKKLSLKGEQLLTKSEQLILNSVLEISYGISGVQDSDDACMRCARRMVAEVLGLSLENYRLIGESNVTPKYYKNI